MTVMQWSNSDGIKGRCDAKCHGAVLSPCTCMCGGRYHGAAHDPGGVEQIMRHEGDLILERARERCRKAGFELKAKSVVELFGEQTSLL